MEQPTLVEVVSAVPSVRPLSFWQMAAAVFVGLWFFALTAAALAMTVLGGLLSSLD